MQRINLTDNSGKWFDVEKAQMFKEGSRWNGRNHISLATSDQFEHEALYITKSGKIIKNCYSQWQGSVETYHEIDTETAFQWFQKNEYTEEMLPENLREKFLLYLNDNEI